jgi:hypothetical protein
MLGSGPSPTDFLAAPFLDFHGKVNGRFKAQELKRSSRSSNAIKHSYRQEVFAGLTLTRAANISQRSGSNATRLLRWLVFHFFHCIESTRFLH